MICSSRNESLTDIAVLVFGRLTQAIETIKVSLMTSVRKVQTSSVHTGINKSLKLLHLPTSRTKSTNNLCSSESCQYQ